MSVQAAETARLGPFRIVGAADAPGRFDGARRRIARDDRTGRMAVLMLPAEELAEDPGYRVRFRAEAENSRRLTGFWAAPVIDIAPAHEDLPWVAYDCFPVLSLAGALAASKGPLPEPTVRALGTVLAQALAGWHASGLVHAGISPATTLLMADGPRLTGYGLVRAAALDGSERARPPESTPSACRRSSERATGPARPETSTRWVPCSVTPRRDTRTSRTCHGRPCRSRWAASSPLACRPTPKRVHSRSPWPGNCVPPGPRTPRAGCRPPSWRPSASWKRRIPRSPRGRAPRPRPSRARRRGRDLPGAP